MKVYYDIAIIGANFAGLTLAFHLPSYLKIAIIERKPKDAKFVESTALITKCTEKLLRKFIHDLGNSLTNEIYSICVVNSTFRDHFTSTYKEEPWAFTTDSANIIKNIRNKLGRNVTLFYNESYRKSQFNPANSTHFITTSKRILSAKFLVGADGSLSRVAQNNPKLSRNTKFLLGQEKLFYGKIKLGDNPLNTVYHYWFGEFALGYGGWLAPAIYNGKDAFRVGLAMHKNLPNPNRIDIFIEKLLENKHIEITNSSPIHSYGGVIPINGPLKNIYADNTLLIGDAAGFCGSLIADGIRGAIVSAKIGANLITEYLKNSNEKVFGTIPQKINDFNGLYSYYLKNKLYRALWNLMRRSRTFDLLHSILASEREEFLKQFKDSKDNKGSLISILLKPKHIPKLIKLGIYTIQGLF